MNGIAVLTDDHNMRVTIKHSSKGALVCGAACFVRERLCGIKNTIQLTQKMFQVGGVVAGPIGMAIGGTIGGIKAWHMSKGTLVIILKRDSCVKIVLCTVYLK